MITLEKKPAVNNRMRWLLLFIVTGLFINQVEAKDKKVMNDPVIKILLGTTGKPPFDETAPADILATFNAAVLGQLLDYNSTFELTPGLLKSWTWNYKEGLYDLTLKDDILFHNGRKATSADLEFSLLRGFFSEHRSFYSIYLGNILGVDEVKPGTPFMSGKVKGVKITGPFTVQVKLKNPNPAFLFALTRPYFSLVAKESLTDNLITWKQIPIGAGPYKVVAPFKNGILKIQAVKNSVALKNAELHTLHNKSEQYDISLVQLPQFNSPQFTATTSQYPYVIWTMFFNNVNPLGMDSNFRKALQYALKRSGLIGDTIGATPALELLPKYFWGRAGLNETFDIAKAKELFGKVPNDLMNKTWEIPVFAGKEFSENRQKRLALLKTQLAAAGLKVNFYPYQEKFISRQTAESAPFGISGRVASMLDPLLMFSSFRQTTPYEFERPLKDDGLEELFQAAGKAVEEKERVKTIQALSKHLIDRSLIVPMLEEKSIFFVNKKSIQSAGSQNRPGLLYIDQIKPSGSID